MASISELVQLFNTGELGKLLAREFNGERGHVNPNEDSDLLVVFESDASTPKVGAIAEVVIKHYCQLGYVVSPTINTRDHCFEANISHESGGGFVAVVITTHYPFNEGHKSLRITSAIIV